MPKTLLAVDDSATMRKVLEITFSGEDFHVLPAANRSEALAKVGENPTAVVIDTVLDADDGYATCREIRARAPRAAIILLASRYHPYDQAKGRDAGADDYMDKPFDTQQLIDKMKKLIVAKEAGGPIAAAPPLEQPAGTPPYRAPAQPVSPVAPPVAPIAASPAGAFGVHAPPAPPAHVHAPPAAPSPVAAKPPVQQQPAAAKPRAATLMFPLDSPGAPSPPAMQAPIVRPPAEPPTAAPPPVAAPIAAKPAPPAAAPAIAGAVNGHMAAKLGEMGLTPAQADAVLALSKEIVERVVWEVVPQLAEVIIKEEIARLTKE